MQKEIDMTVFAKRLKEARAERGLTQKELAAMSGVSTVMISSYERTDAETGKNPTLSSVFAIANALDVSIDWLCGNTDVKSFSNEINTKTFLLSYLEFFSTLSEKEIDDLIGGLKSTFDGIAIEIYKPIFNTNDEKNIYSFTKEILDILTVLKKDILPEEIQVTIINKILEKYEKIPLDKLLSESNLTVRPD